MLGISPLGLNAYRSLPFLVFLKQCDTKHSHFATLSLLDCFLCEILFTFALGPAGTNVPQDTLQASDHGIAVPTWHGTECSRCCQEAEGFIHATLFYLCRCCCIAAQTCQRVDATLQDITLQSADRATADRNKHISSEAAFSIRLARQWRGERSSDTAEITGLFPHTLYIMHMVLLHSPAPSAELHTVVIQTRASDST